MSLALACLLALPASAAPGFRVDPALVDSLSDAPPGLMRAEPYLIHFRKGRLNLYYVSARHESRDDSATFVLIRRAFEAFPIRRVIVEGRRNHEGNVPSEDARRIIREAEGGRYKWGEGAYAIALAHKKGIRAIGGEPRKRDAVLALRRAGFATEDVLGHGFVKMIPAYRDQGRLTADGAEALFEETMSWERRELGVPADLSYDFAAFGRWYEARTGAPFDAGKVDYEALRPDSKGSFLQRLSDAASNARNRFLAEVITREVRRHAHVLVVYGSGHHAAQRRALVAAFGEPVYEGALPD